MALGGRLTYRVVVQMPFIGVFTGSEQSQNTWYVQWNGGGAPTLADLDHILGVIKGFYHTPDGSHGFTVERFLGPRVTTDVNAQAAIMYLLPDAPGHTGPPVRELDWTRDSIPNVPLPEQLAVAVSYHADLTGIPEHAGTARPASRRKGRFFVGPLSTQSLGAGEVDGHVTVNGQFIDTLKGRASVVVSSLLGTTWSWVVFSKSTWTAQVVEGGWVDDRFDIIRRRADAERNKNFW